MANDKQIEELVAMLDNFTACGGGHMNVEVVNPNNLDEVDIQTLGSNCCQDNTACQIPTLQTGLDNKK